MRPKTPLALLLDFEFSELAGRGMAGAGGDNLGTNKSQAKFLSIDSSQYSRIRAGKRPLTGLLAARFAAALRDTDELRQELSRKLLDASKGEPFQGARAAAESRISLDNASAFFHRLGNANSLLCCEYRDMPRAAPGAAHSRYALVAGEAIAKGLSFAMFQPFGAPEGIHEHASRHTERVRSFLYTLSLEVRRVYDAMRKAAINELGRDANGQSKEHEAEIDKRLVLYEFAPPPASAFLGSGIQTRLFYAELLNDRARGEEYEVWEWIAAVGGDLFVMRDKESLTTQAVAEQFFPIVEYWRGYRRLPVDPNELTGALKEFQSQEVGSMTTVPWSPYRKDTNGRTRSGRSKRTR